MAFGPGNMIGFILKKEGPLRFHLIISFVREQFARDCRRSMSMIAESRARFLDFSIKGKALWFYFFIDKMWVRLILGLISFSF